LSLLQAIQLNFFQSAVFKSGWGPKHAMTQLLDLHAQPQPLA
jgi:hypothetical protein